MDDTVKYESCYKSHKPLVIAGKYSIYGGSCSSPIITDADVYVGFQTGMKSSNKSFPWIPGESFLFAINDGCAPTDVPQFKNMVKFLAKQLQDGKKVHIGCIGGHGRTGTVLAALVKIMTGEKNAIEFVRKNYCKKAVETDSQIDFLHKHYGITKVSQTKTTYKVESSYYNKGGYSHTSWPKKTGNSPFKNDILTISPLPTAKGKVWD